MDLPDVDADAAQERRTMAARSWSGYAIMRWHLGYPLGDVEWRAEGPREWVLPGEVPLYGRDQPLPAPVRQGVSWAQADAPALRPVPTAREQVLMTLASLIAAHWPVLSDNPTTWPETLCALVWEALTPEVCLTAFAVPLRPLEAFARCWAEALDWYAEHEAIIACLAAELVERARWSGAEVTAYLNDPRASWNQPEYNAPPS